MYNCVDTIQVSSLTVHPLPTSDFSWNPKVPTLDDPTINFVNESKNAVSYIWYFMSGDSSNSFSPSYSIKDTGGHTITLIAISDKNCKDTAYKKVIINANYRLFIPNAFSPNGDGINDLWIPFTSGVEDLEYFIYNRWGELIFKGTDKQAWDGYFMSERVYQGVYLYQIKVKPKNKSFMFYKGTFHVLD